MANEFSFYQILWSLGVGLVVFVFLRSLTSAVLSGGGEPGVFAKAKQQLFTLLGLLSFLIHLCCICGVLGLAFCFCHFVLGIDPNHPQPAPKSDSRGK